MLAPDRLTSELGTIISRTTRIETFIVLPAQAVDEVVLFVSTPDRDAVVVSLLSDLAKST